MHSPCTSNHEGTILFFGHHRYKPTADLYYLEGSLELLDMETEWHYERSTRQIHLKTRGDVHPSAMRVTARVQTYALAVIGCTHLVIHGMRLFATTVYVGGEGSSSGQDVHNIRLDSLQLVHPSATKRILGEHRFSWPTTLARKRTADAANNTLYNCSFFGAEGHPLINSAVLMSWIEPGYAVDDYLSFLLGLTCPYGYAEDDPSSLVGSSARQTWLDPS